MKELLGAKKFKLNPLPSYQKIKEPEITRSFKIANGLNNFLIRIGPNLASSITNTAKIYKGYLIPSENNLKFHDLFIEEFETAFNLILDGG